MKRHRVGRLIFNDGVGNSFPRQSLLHVTPDPYPILLTLPILLKYLNEEDREDFLRKLEYRWSLQSNYEWHRHKRKAKMKRAKSRKFSSYQKRHMSNT